MCWVILSSTVLELHLDVISIYNLQPLGSTHPSQGRRTDGNSLLKCGDHCALVPAKAGSLWTKSVRRGLFFVVVLVAKLLSSFVAVVLRFGSLLRCEF